MSGDLFLSIFAPSYSTSYMIPMHHRIFNTFFCHLVYPYGTVMVHSLRSGYLLVDLGEDPIHVSHLAVSCLIRYTHSLSRNSWYSSSPALTGDPPNYTKSAVPCYLHAEATYLGNQHAVANDHAHGQAVALLVESTGSDSQDLGLVELLDARLGQEDAAGSLGIGLDALDEDAIQQRSEGADGADGGGLR